MRGPSLAAKLGGEELAERLKVALRGVDYEATVNDLVVITGFPPHEVEEALELLASRYRSAYSVSDVGELRYRFPFGFDEARRRPDSWRSVLPRLKRRGGAIVRRLLKQWLLVLLAGYAAVFLTFLFPPVLVIFVILLGSWVRGDAFRDYEAEEYYDYRLRVAANGGVDTWRRVRTRKTPAHADRAQPVSARELLYTYLFGDTRARRSEGQAVLVEILSFIADRKGIVSLEEIMLLTGMSHGEAEDYAGRLLSTYDGEPSVTEEGTVIYDFADLARSAAAIESREAPTRFDRRFIAERSSIPDDIQRSGERTISTLNFFNLFFGVYYGTISLEYLVHGDAVPQLSGGSNVGLSLLFNSVYSFMVSSHITHSVFAILAAFGIVPVGLAVTFFILHLGARHRDGVSQRERLRKRLRKQIYREIVAQSAPVDPASIVVEEPDTPPLRNVRGFVSKVLDELAADYDGEIEDLGEGHYVYYFRELEQKLQDVARQRSASSLPPR